MDALHNTISNIIVSDTSVLINFLKINRLDLLDTCSLRVLITDHVREEITNGYPDQLQRFQKGLQQNFLEEISITDPAAIELFVILHAKNKCLGYGECSAIAAAVHYKYLLAIDDKVAIESAFSLAPHLPILRTQDLIVKMIKEKVLTLVEADRILHEWATTHRFKLKISSFNELLPQHECRC